MVKQLAYIILTAILFISCNNNGSINDNTISDDAEFLHKADSLLQLMTFDEKTGQLLQRWVMEPGEIDYEAIRQGKVGSMLHSLAGFFTPHERNKMQRIAIEESRLGIPIIFGHDVIHGFKTIFPISLAQSCTWSPELIEKAAAVSAKEASTYGVDWTFAPMVDVSRDPRWGRIAECYGEDTYLNSRMGVAAIKGFQGENLSDTGKLVACLKHYVGYSESMGGRDYQYTDVSERTMHEVYLPPFKAGIDAGALTIMSGFNDINGVPATANHKYLNETLRNKWNYQGMVLSDWNAVYHLLRHGYAKDSLEAGLKSISAGLDVEMKSNTYELLKDALESEKLDISVINNAVRRVLFVKLKKGLFEKPYADTAKIKNHILTLEHRKLARKVASESMVLLKNKNAVLPVNKGNIAIVGPYAKEQDLMGWWKSLGKKQDVISPFSGLANNAPENINVYHEITPATDIIVACVGESKFLFGENNSRSDIKLPNNQEEYILSLKRYNKPIAVVVFNGRPLDFTAIEANVDAILLAWHPGTEAGNALADIMYGYENPSGKLTASFPRSAGQIPVYYNHRNSGRPRFDYYKDQSGEPLYPFGFGLSYSRFKYDSLTLSSTKLTENDSITISANITNISEITGEEIVQLYIRDLVGSTTRPIKELKSFSKILLKSGETKKVSFVLKPSDLLVLDENFTPQVEAGKFHVWIAPNSIDGLQAEFTLIN